MTILLAQFGRCFTVKLRPQVIIKSQPPICLDQEPATNPSLVCFLVESIFICNFRFALVGLMLSWCWKVMNFAHPRRGWLFFAIYRIVNQHLFMYYWAGKYSPLILLSLLMYSVYQGYSNNQFLIYVKEISRFLDGRIVSSIKPKCVNWFSFYLKCLYYLNMSKINLCRNFYCLRILIRIICTVLSPFL